MLIYDVLHKEKVYQIVASNLRTLGVKYRLKKNTVKTEKLERNAQVFKKVFKTPLSYLPLDVVNLQTGAIIHVPIFVSQAAKFLLKRVHEEGLFRKAGSQVRQKEIISRLDNGESLGEKNSAIDVANCLKTFLRNLPEPLIPYIYHDLFVRCGMLKINKIDAILLACILLPPHHLNTLAYIMEFLKMVASHENQNKMSIDNLARVVGPNIMPLQETTMVAVQSRLDAHLNIVKLLIENADKIGVLPTNISEAISMDAVGSIDNELNQSDPTSSFKNKRKKHRSGSLTRMLSGLKKIVSKNHSPSGMDALESNLLNSESNLNLYTPTIKTGKKRKVVETVESSYIKKNSLKEKSPSQKTGVQKYLSQKIHSETKNNEKHEKTKKLRLSLDRFVPKGKQKIYDQNNENRKNSFSPCLNRRWSASNKTLDNLKRRRTRSVGSNPSSPQNKIRNSSTSKTLEEVFMDADINLSDDGGEKLMQEETSSDENFNIEQLNSVKSSINSYSLRNSSLQRLSNYSEEIEPKMEEYVKIPKSEYEEIKSRVLAIESCISQEFKSISNESNNELQINSINKVQTEYEKTLEGASIESTASTDQLAKRLSKELKIRRSADHKVIRSPSARKIGNIRRRSQEKPVSKKLHRTATWHITDRPEVRRSILKSNSLSSNSPKHCNLKRGRPIVKRDSYKSLDQTPKSNVTFCSDETNARLDYLQKQLNTLISHTAEHTRGSFSDDDFIPFDDCVFKNCAQTKKILSERNSLKTPAVRRASSFHSSEFFDNSQYFNNKIKELKKTNSQQNLKIELNESSNNVYKKPMATPTPRKEKSVSWKDADDYFKQEAKMLTPLPTTGRASVAKLRTQNAGMVLAKAKLFDDPTKEAVDISRRQSMKLQLAARVTTKEGQRTPNSNKKQNGNDVIFRRKNTHNTNRRSPNNSSVIKMEVTINSGGRRQSTRFNSPRLIKEQSSHKSHKENLLVQSVPNSVNLQLENNHSIKLSESPLCQTPLIKKPLSIKTPKSAKSLSSRKSVMNSRRTPLKAVLPITPKRQSPRIVLKSTQINRHINLS